MSSDWTWVTLADICSEGGTIQTGPFGSQLHAKDYVEVGTPVVMPVNIGDNRLVEAGIARITAEDVKRLSRHKLRFGDIVYSRRGDVTKRALIQRNQEGWLCGTGCLLVRPNASVDSRWLSYWLGTPQTRDWIERHAVGATMPNLNTSILSAVPVFLPPLATQQWIGQALGALDALIDTDLALAADLEELMASEFAAHGFDKEGTTGSRLGDFVRINPDSAKPKGDAPYIDMAALPTDSALVAKVDRRQAAGGARFSNGDTVMARITPCLENGKTAYIDCLLEGEIGVGSTEFIVLRPLAGVAGPWAYFLARSPRFRDYAVRHMSGTSGRQRCSAEAIDAYPIQAPASAALAAFNELVERLVPAMRELRDEVDDVRRVRDELLPILLTGALAIRKSAA